VLSSAPQYSTCFIFCHYYFNQNFDMHGTNGGYGDVGGFYVDIVGNTFLTTDNFDARQNYWLRGIPSIYTDFHSNVSLRNQNDAVQLHLCSPTTVCIGGPPLPINFFNNLFQDSSPPSTDPTARLAVGDFDGDGTQDLFLATGASWYFSPGGSAEWRFLNGAHDTLDQLLLGDFDGDGRTDVVGLRNGQLVVSWGGISSYEVLNANPLPCSSMSDMAVGDFDGDGHPDIFCADGKNWWISYGGNTPFVNVNTSSFHRQDLLFGDFDGNGTTDVFAPVFDNSNNLWWSITPSALGGWVNLQPALTRTVNDLVAADFNGDGFADVGMLCSSGGWEISYGGTQGWSNCSTLASLSPVNGGVGHFSGGTGADLLLWNGNGIWVVPAGTGLPQAFSTQDMH
jgi:hypothetical protein